MNLRFVPDDEMPEIIPDTLFIYRNSKGMYSTVYVDSNGKWTGIRPLPLELDSKKKIKAWFFRQKLEGKRDFR